MIDSSGVVSLFELLQFHAKSFVQLANLLREMEALGQIASGIDNVATLKDSERVSGLSDVMRNLSAIHGLPLSSKKAKRICEEIKRNGPMQYKEIHRHLRELRERFEDELEDQRFLHLQRADADLYESPINGWEEIIKRFPETLQNIIESSKCFALERYAASVFHVLLVAEFGVIKIAKLMEVAGDKPGWGSLQKVERLIEKPYPERVPLAQKHSELLENVVGLTKVMKDSWRHKISHVDNQILWQDTDFSGEVAHEIIIATRGFMRKLVKELPHDDGTKQLRFDNEEDTLGLKAGITEAD